jgi:hypothetical protein
MTDASFGEWLESQKDGAHCPHCRQYVKAYFRLVTSDMARILIGLYRCHKAAPGEWVHVQREFGAKGGDYAKLRWWELIEQKPGLREDTSSRNGWWRIADPGIWWVDGRMRLPRYAVTYNNEMIRLSDHTASGRLTAPVSIRDALGEKFDFETLMKGDG